MANKNQKTTSYYVTRNVNGIPDIQDGEDYKNNDWGSGTLYGKNWKATQNLNTVLNYLSGFKQLLPQNNRFDTVSNELSKFKTVRELQDHLIKNGYSNLKNGQKPLLHKGFCLKFFQFAAEHRRQFGFH